jgi:hypothetical protein
MIARFFLIAGIAGGSLIAANPATAQSLPLGAAINAIGHAQRSGAAPSSSDSGRMSGSGRPKGAATPSRPVARQPYSDRPARRKHPVNISQDNG